MLLMFIVYTLLAFLEMQTKGAACGSVLVPLGIGLLALAMFVTYRQELEQSESENETELGIMP